MLTPQSISGAYRQVGWKPPACPSPTWAIGHHKTFAMMDIDLPLVVHLGKTSSNRKLGQRDNWDWDGESEPSRGNSICKGPEVRVHLEE